MSAEAITKQVERILTGITLDKDHANRLHDAVQEVTNPDTVEETGAESFERQLKHNIVFSQPFNKLTPAQAERLDLLAEELAEAIKAIMKDQATRIRIA